MIAGICRNGPASGRLEAPEFKAFPVPTPKSKRLLFAGICRNPCREDRLGDGLRKDFGCAEKTQ